MTALNVTAALVGALAVFFVVSAAADPRIRSVNSFGIAMFIGGIAAVIWGVADMVL